MGDDIILRVKGTKDISVPPGFMVLSPDWGDKMHQWDWEGVLAKLPGLVAIRLRRMAPLQRQQVVMPQPTHSWLQGYGEKLSDMHRAKISTSQTEHHAGMSVGAKAVKVKKISKRNKAHHAGMSEEDKAVRGKKISKGLTDYHAGMSVEAKAARGKKMSATKLAGKVQSPKQIAGAANQAKHRAKVKAAAAAAAAKKAGGAAN